MLNVNDLISTIMWHVSISLV